MDQQKKAMNREFTIIANWKMNKTIREATEYVDSLVKGLEGRTIGVWLGVPFTAIHPLSEKLANTGILVGAQNMNDATHGAFTGEIAGIMIKEAGGEFVILGHSERRQYFHESDEFINKKILRAVECKLKPVFCIGEGYEDRESGNTKNILEKQLSEGLKGVPAEELGSFIIAYEPVWAIGTGKTATPEMVEETHAMIRNIIEGLYSKDVAMSLPIVYGGSVSLQSAEALTKTEGVDGFLVGTASLVPETFAKIVQLSENALS
jgi:triosephosphate isomerase